MKIVVLRRFETMQGAVNWMGAVQGIYGKEIHTDEMPDDYNTGNFAVYYFR